MASQSICGRFVSATIFDESFDCASFKLAIKFFSWWLFSLVEFGLLYNTSRLMMFLPILIFKNKFSQREELYVFEK